MMAACCSHRSIMSRAGWSSFKNKCFVQACCVLKSDFLVIEGWIPLKDCLSIVMTKRRKTLQRWDKEGQMEVLISWLKPRCAPCFLGSPGDQVNLRTTPYLPLLLWEGEESWHLSKWHHLTPSLSLLSCLWSHSRTFSSKWMFPGINCKYPFHALPMLRQSWAVVTDPEWFCSCMSQVFYSLLLFTVGQTGEADTLEIPSKWPSPWAAFNSINQNYPFLFVSAIWPVSTKENYICVYLNTAVIS